jgi:hypothetical protein
MKDIVDSILMWTCILLMIAFFGMVLYLVWTADDYDPNEKLMIKLLFTDAIAIVFCATAALLIAKSGKQ